MYICERCKINKATKKYKTNKIIKNGANSYRGFDVHRVCEECWSHIIKGEKNK